MALDYEWWEYFTIPWIAGFVGYVTNVLALEMTFYPIEYKGFNLFRIKDQPWGFIGWQGIIPTKTEKMAGLCFDLFTEKLFKVREIFNRLDPTRFSEVMSDSVLLLMDNIINDVANQYIPNVWNSLPKEVKDDIIVTAEQEGHNFLIDFMKDMQDHIDDVVDIKHLAVSTCAANKHLMVQVFQDCGQKEFVFIRRSGFYFGFIFGVFQMLVWFVYDEPWVLPVFGFIVGWITNWLALKCIFQPLDPTKICGIWEIQGLFLKRQNEVSELFARSVMTEVLNIKAIWEAVFTGPLSKNFFAMLRAHTLVFTEKLVIEIQPIAVAALGAQQFAQMKEDIATKVIEQMPSIIDNSFEYTQEALDMENSVRINLQKLSTKEFEGILHPAFKEDEIQLIILGGILGLLVGIIQLYTVFQ